MQEEPDPVHGGEADVSIDVEDAERGQPQQAGLILI